MANLRKLAKGQPCMVRLPGVCNGNQETTVLAHYRMAGICGAGQKPIDECGAWACSSCHSFVDGGYVNKHDWMRESARLAHAEGVMRTLDALHRLGYSMQKGK